MPALTERIVVYIKAICTIRVNSGGFFCMWLKSVIAIIYMTIGYFLKSLPSRTYFTFWPSKIKIIVLMFCKWIRVDIQKRHERNLVLPRYWFLHTTVQYQGTCPVRQTGTAGTLQFPGSFQQNHMHLLQFCLIPSLLSYALPRKLFICKSALLI